MGLVLVFFLFVALRNQALIKIKIIEIYLIFFLKQQLSYEPSFCICFYILSFSNSNVKNLLIEIPLFFFVFSI